MNKYKAKPRRVLPAELFCWSALAKRPLAVPGRVKGFRCQFRARREGIQHPKDAARGGKLPVYGGRGR